MDSELIELTKNMSSNGVDELEDWRFLASCLQIGLSIQDLKELQYKDVAKIMICIMRDHEDSKNGGKRKATQTDIDKLLR